MRTLDFTEVAKLASEILGREIARETVSDEEYRATLISHGLPEMMADIFLTLYTAARMREFAVIDPALERRLGRKPTEMRDVLNDFFERSDSNIFQGN